MPIYPKVLTPRKRVVVRQQIQAWSRRKCGPPDATHAVMFSRQLTATLFFFFFFFLPSTPSRTTSNVDAVLSQQCIHSEPELFVTKGELLFGTSSIQCIICWWSAISLLRHVGHVGFLVGGHEIGSYARKILSSSCLWSILTEFTLTCIWCSGEGKWCRVPLSQLVGGLWCRVLLF